MRIVKTIIVQLTVFISKIKWCEAIDLPCIDSKWFSPSLRRIGENGESVHHGNIVGIGSSRNGRLWKIQFLKIRQVGDYIWGSFVECAGIAA